MMHASVAVPDWPVAAAVSAGQVGSDEPAAVLGVGGVVSANAWARRLGVRTGMRKREALSICPELVAVQRDVRRDALRFESVLRAVDAHVAHVVAVEPGRVIFPARGAVRAAGSMEALAEALIGQIADVAGCEAHVGCGEGTLAALLAAQSDVFLDVEGSARFLERAKVEGTLVGVAPSCRGEARSCLELLAALGVRTVGGLADLGAAAMASRFGAMGSLLWQLARGRDVYLPTQAPTSPGIVCTRVFEPPLQSVEEAVFSARGLAEELVRLTLPDRPAHDSRVFLANSGTEANEAAFKIARRHGGSRRPRVLALQDAFHGRTMGALALTHKAAYREPFEPLPGGVEFIPAGDIEALRTAMGPDVAALVIEPIQGEAGVRELPAGYLEAARELTEAAGALLIIDEVQTGMGRTGAWMAHHLLAPGVVPDVVTLAKGLGGGIPIGAVVATGQAAALLEPGQHGTTFGGNPVACAAALAVIGTIRSQSLLERVQQLGSAWSRQLAAVDGVDQVRGRGLLLGVGLEDGLPPAAEIAAALAAGGFIVNAPRPDTIRLAPPFILSDDDAGAFTTTLSEVLARAQSEKAGS